MVRARVEIGRLQRRLWERQKKLIAASVVGGGPAFRAYEQEYLRRTRRFAREASFAEVLHAAAEADLVYVGDYHTLKQSQRSFLKLVQQRRSRRPLVLALEFVQGRHQRALDAWLEGALSEDAFLARIEYARHARFETWPHFKPIFEEARRRALPVVAIDLLGGARTSLEERDGYAARRIAQSVARRPQAQHFVLAGQLHVAPAHLPAAVQRDLAGRRLPAPRALVIYQNCERIWWELQRRGRELEAEACLLRQGELCLLNTPPQVVQQSYLDCIEGGGEPLDAAALESRFRLLARTVARFFGLDTRALREALQEVAVYAAGDLSFLERLPLAPRERRQLERQILSRESWALPRARIAYLANLSVNHAAEEAAHFVRGVVSGAGDEPRSVPDAFYARVLEEAYAFCGSKIVNPRRKCPHEPQFERLLRDRRAFTRAVARAVLEHLRAERGGPLPLRPARALSRHAGPALFNAVTHALGYMLGERLYYALATGRVRKSEVRGLLLDPLREEGQAFVTWFTLSRRLAAVRIPARS